MNTLKFIRGDTFLLSGTYTLDDPSEVFPEAITSQLRTSGDSVIADLDVAIGTPDGGVLPFTLRAADTTGWPLTLAQGDVRFVYPDGSSQHTVDRFVVNIAKPVTHG